MNLKRPIRFTLVALLTAVGVIALLGVIRHLQLASIVNFNPRNLIYIFGIAGGVTLLCFISITTRRLLRNDLMPRDVFVISVILSTIAAGVALLFAYGLFKDLSGAHCTGFFGSQSSCTLSPVLILYVIILHPFSLLIAGILSAYGVYRQSSRGSK